VAAPAEGSVTGLTALFAPELPRFTDSVARTACIE
jgi:hypothetical protein